MPGQTRVGKPVEWQIVGVVRDVKNRGTRNDVRPEIDVPFAQSPWPRAVVDACARRGDPNALRSSIGGVIQQMDPDLPMAGVRTMEQLGPRARSRTTASTRCSSRPSRSWRWSLAAIGIYGVMSFVVAQRRHEVGLRMALGADRGQVVRLVMRRRDDARRSVGTALGFAGAYGVGRAMQGMWFGVGALDSGRFARDRAHADRDGALRLLRAGAPCVDGRSGGGAARALRPSDATAQR